MRTAAGVIGAISAVCGAIFDIKTALLSSVELKIAIKPRAISHIGFSVWSNAPVLYFHSAPVFLDLAMTRVTWRSFKKRDFQKVLAAD